LKLVKKYKNYLNKIKPNLVVLNSIKRKYELIKKQKKTKYLIAIIDIKYKKLMILLNLQMF